MFLPSISVASTYLPFWCSLGFTKMCLLTRTNMPHMRRIGDTYKYFPILPVRQYRLLPVGFLHCCRCQQPACHLLMLSQCLGTHKGLTPSGNLLLHTYYLFRLKICILRIYSDLLNKCAHAHAGHTHAI